MTYATTPASVDFASGITPSTSIVVTGGSGFIGTNLVQAYIDAGVRVANIDVSPPRNPAHASLYHFADFTSAPALTSLLEELEATHIFHLAARTDLRGTTLDDYRINVEGVQVLLESIRAYSGDIERLVVTSSRMVCEIGYQPTSDTDYRPSTPYGASKVRTEQIVRAASDIPWTMGRPTSIWGPWFDVPYRDFFLSIAKGRYVHPRGERIFKNFGYVGNTIWQLHRLMVAPPDGVLGKTMYLADDPAIEVRDFADRISAALQTRQAPNVPVGILRAIASVGDAVERTGRSAPLTSFRLANLRTQMPYDLKPILDIAGTPPIGLDESVPATVEWLRTQRLV